MATVTLSLPEQIIKKLDREAKKSGFSTRSEYVRNILRTHFSDKSGGTLEFKPFVPKPLEEIRKSFEKTGLYNKKFIDSVINGLSKSSFYENKTS